MPASKRVPHAMAEPAADPVQLAIEQWGAERPELDAFPLAIFGRIARLAALSRRAQAKTHDRYGLSYAAFDMLANLRRSGTPHRKTATSLADSSLISTGGVTFRMDALERSGLIRRVGDTHDRRVVYAELTSEGREVIDKAVAAHFASEHELLNGLSHAEQQQLATLLAKLERSIEAATDD